MVFNMMSSHGYPPKRTTGFFIKSVSPDLEVAPWCCTVKCSEKPLPGIFFTMHSVQYVTHAVSSSLRSSSKLLLDVWEIFMKLVLQYEQNKRFPQVLWEKTQQQQLFPIGSTLISARTSTRIVMKILLKLILLL